MNVHTPSKSNANSTQILGFILNVYTCTLQRMQPILQAYSILILGSVFSDLVVFYNDIMVQIIL